MTNLSKQELIVMESIYARRGGTCNTSQVTGDSRYRDPWLTRSAVQRVIDRNWKLVKDEPKNAAHRWRLTPAGVEAMKAAQGAAPAPGPKPVPPGVLAAKENAGLLAHIRADHAVQPPAAFTYRELPDWHVGQPCSGWEA